MPANIAAYEWLLTGTAHITYQTEDSHLREIVGEKNGKWRDADVTREAGGPQLESATMTGFDWPDGQTHQIAYTSPMSNIGHIYELVQLVDHPWSYEDLMGQPTGAPEADGRSLVGYSTKTASKHIVYTSLDGHIHMLSAGRIGGWQHTNLTEATRSPHAEGGALSAFAWETANSQHVVYISGNGHIHELLLNAGGSWQHSDLTERTGAPVADEASSLVSFGWERERTKQIFYTGNNGNIYEMVAGTDSDWLYKDLMSETGAPLVSGSALTGFAWETGNTKVVAYVAENQRVQELQFDSNGRWTHSDIIGKAGAPGASNTLLAGHEWSSQFGKHIVYLDLRENPHLHSLLFKHGGRWEHTDLTDLTGAQPLV
jgi:hypothetical protein